MKITDIKVFPVREEKLKAFVSIVLDDCFMVNDIKVIRGKEGFFISMPSRRKRNGKFKDIAHPLNNETRQSMEKEILAAYEKGFEGAPEERAEVRVRRTAGAGPANARRRRRASQPPAPPASVAPPAPDSEADEPRVIRAPEAARVDADNVASPPNEPEDTDKSLEEVTEHHLDDSFWGT